MTVRKQVQEAEWVQPRRRNYVLECCDCGLVHRLNFRLVKTLNGGRSIQFQAFRDNRKTAATRRACKPNGAERLTTDCS